MRQKQNLINAKPAEAITFSPCLTCGPVALGDCALPRGGRERYERGGRERSGYAIPARLLVGQTAFAHGKPQRAFAPQLYVHVRRGKLFTCNKGPDIDFPGFLICPTCGRELDPDNPGTHSYPANVPPFTGRNRGPRAGSLCPKGSDCTNQVILGHDFYSEVILLGCLFTRRTGRPLCITVWTGDLALFWRLGHQRCRACSAN